MANVDTVSGENAGAYATFRPGSGRVIEARVGTSFISIEQARKNLRIEIHDWDMDRVSQSLKSQLNRKLGAISIGRASDDERRIFYTATYHALLLPKLFPEHGKYYSAFDDSIHQGTSYTAFFIWDTFRAEHSLLTLIAPAKVDAMIGALLQALVYLTRQNDTVQYCIESMRLA